METAVCLTIAVGVGVLGAAVAICGAKTKKQTVNSGKLRTKSIVEAFDYLSQ